MTDNGQVLALEHRRMLAQFERLLQSQKEEYEDRLRSQKEEYEERLRVQREEIMGSVDSLRTTVNERWYDPFLFIHFPPEIIALIADYVYDFDQLATMTLVSRHVRRGVLLCRRWIVVDEIMAAYSGDVWEQRWSLTRGNRHICAMSACRKGSVRCLCVLDLSRDEVVANDFSLVIDGACKARQAGVLAYLHTTYQLTADELTPLLPPSWLRERAKGNTERAKGKTEKRRPTKNTPFHTGAMTTLRRRELREAGKTGVTVIQLKEGETFVDVVRYLHAEVGVEPAREMLTTAAELGDYETLKYLHTEIGFSDDDVRQLNLAPLREASRNAHRACLVYFRDGYGLTKEDATSALTAPLWRLPVTQSVFFPPEEKPQNTNGTAVVDVADTMECLCVQGESMCSVCTNVSNNERAPLLL